MRGFPLLAGLAASLMMAVPACAETSPAAEKAADRLIVAQHLKEQMTGMLPVIVDKVMRAVMQAQAQDKAREQEARKIVIEEFSASFGKTIPTLIAKHRDLYLAMFDADELAGLATFYETPLGQKFIAKSPLIQAEMAKFGAEAGRAAGIDAQTRILDRLRKANFNLPAGV
jgi:hypothetical protein